MGSVTTAPVSVIVPCFRCTDTIVRAVESIAAQSLLPAEVILVDDFSGDGTVEILHAIKDAYSQGWIKVIESRGNAGPASARNVGWNHASSDFIAFLDADDTWHPEKIKFQYGWMASNPQAVLTSHACVTADAGRPFVAEDFLPISAPRLLLSNCFLTLTVMVKRGIDARFAEGKRHSEDYLLWLTVCLKGGACYFSRSVLGYTHKHAYGESGLSKNLLDMERGELQVFRALQREGMLSAATMVLASGFSLAKFLRRVVIVAIRNRAQGLRSW